MWQILYRNILHATFPLSLVSITIPMPIIASLSLNLHVPLTILIPWLILSSITLSSHLMLRGLCMYHPLKLFPFDFKIIISNLGLKWFSNFWFLNVFKSSNFPSLGFSDTNISFLIKFGRHFLFGGPLSNFLCFSKCFKISVNLFFVIIGDRIHEINSYKNKRALVGAQHQINFL